MWIVLIATCGCWASHGREGRPEEDAAPDTCEAQRGLCEGSDLGCRRLGSGDDYVYAGNADCIERGAGYACCVPRALWIPRAIGERCFLDDMLCASGVCADLGAIAVCVTGAPCDGAPSRCGSDEHCAMRDDTEGWCLPRCAGGTCPGELACEAGLCVAPR